MTVNNSELDWQTSSELTVKGSHEPVDKPHLMGMCWQHIFSDIDDHHL